MIEKKKDQTEYKTTLDKKLEHWHKTTKSIETANADAKTGIDRMLTEGEQILIYADQSRMMPGGSIATPNSIYVTNKRIIFRNPRMWGLKVDLMDYAYKDLANVELHKGIFTTEIELTPRFNSEKVKLPAVSKEIAEELFGAIRKGMHGDFGLDDVTGNLVVQQQKPDDPISKLERLSALKEKGMISDNEFEAVKTKLLSEI
ncbi:MAG: PH domain-containing protein [Nitrososphaeraceae archaeon]